MTTVHRLQRVATGELGQAIMEFAVTIPIVLLLFFGLIDFSRAAYTAAVVQWAAQEGARTGTIHPDAASVTAAAQARLVGLQADQAAVTFTPPDAGTVTVQVSYPFVFVTPVIAEIAGSGVTMQGSASMIAQPAISSPSP